MQELCEKLSKGTGLKSDLRFKWWVGSYPGRWGNGKSIREYCSLRNRGVWTSYIWKLLVLRARMGYRGEAFNIGKSHLLCCTLFELHYIQTLQHIERERRACMVCFIDLGPWMEHCRVQGQRLNTLKNAMQGSRHEQQWHCLWSTSNLINIKISRDADDGYKEKSRMVFNFLVYMTRQIIMSPPKTLCVPGRVCLKDNRFIWDNRNISGTPRVTHLQQLFQFSRVPQHCQ